MVEHNEDNRRGARVRMRRFSLLRRFSRSSRGSTAIEFGFVALPFLTLLLAILETALVFHAQVMLDMGLNEAARLVRTGQAQELGLNEEEFRNEVCERAYGVIDCADAIYVDVRAFDNFEDINLPEPIDDDGEVEEGFTYEAGIEGEIVVARAFYEMFLFTPSAWGVGLSNLANGNRLLTSTATFRNEPFGDILE